MNQWLPILSFAAVSVVTWSLCRTGYNQIAHILNSGADNSAVTHESELQRLLDTAGRYFDERKWTAAEKAYLKALKMDHKNLVAYRRLAMVYSYLHNYEDAIECLELVMRRETSATDLQNYATMIYHTGDTDKAIAALDRAIELEPTLSRYVAQAKLCSLSGADDRQLESLLAAYELDRSNHAVVTMISQWYGQRKDYENQRRWAAIDKIA